MEPETFRAFSFIGDDFTILYLRGECDLSTVSELEEACDRVPNDRRLIIDAFDLDFIDCLSVAVLARLANRLPEAEAVARGVSWIQAKLLSLTTIGVLDPEVEARGSPADVSRHGSYLAVPDD